MTRERSILAIFAHPDDETLATGSTLAKYAAEGVRVHLLCATRGERGWKLGANPGPHAVARRRSEELAEASLELGIASVGFLDACDGKVAQALGPEIVARVATHIDVLEPQVVITFGPDGAYGHPDHIAVSQLTTAALVAATHRVQKLYWVAWSKAQNRAYTSVVGDVRSTVDGVVRRFAGWDDWAITTRIDARPYVDRVRRAALHHRSQLRDRAALEREPLATWTELYGEQGFYRVYSLGVTRSRPERDLFEGIGPTEAKEQRSTGFAPHVRPEPAQTGARS